MGSNPIAAAAFNAAASISRLALVAIFAYAALHKAHIALALAVLSIGAAYVAQCMEALRYREINADETIREWCNDYAGRVVAISVALWLASFICAFIGW